MPSTTRIRSNPGFTLLEVLVGLSIMAVIVAVAFTGLSIGIDSWRRGTRKIEELDQRFAVERLLQRQIGTAIPGPFQGSNNQPFQGSNNQLSFMSGYSKANGAGHPVWVKYAGDEKDLLYSETSAAEYVANLPTAEVTQRFQGTYPVAFRYLYMMPNKQAEWVNQTNLSTQDLPLAIRVEIAGDTLTVPVPRPKVSTP